MKMLKTGFAAGLFMLAACAFADDCDLVKDGKATSCIVLPDNAGLAEKHAANELALFLEKVTGAKLAIRDTPSKDLCNIYLGTAEAKNMPRSAAVDTAVSRLKDDGFVLAADKDGVRVIGKKPVGVLYGAYEILKKYADMRWFAPGAEYEWFAKKQSVSVPEQITVSNPSLAIRRFWFACSVPGTNSWDWMVRNGVTIQAYKREYKTWRAELEKRGAVILDGGNCFYQLLGDDLFAEHPEYFPLIDGKREKTAGASGANCRQPCTSNPKVAEIMAESLDKYLETTPKGGSYLVGNNDGTIWCQCENCKKIDPPDEKQKKYMGTRYYTFINKVAGEVYKTHPDADLWAYAYQNFQYPPTGVVPDPRISVQAAIHGRCYRHSMADLRCKVNDRYRDILSQWGKLKNTVSTLEFINASCFPSGYLPLEHVLTEDVKYYKKIGLAGCTFFTNPPDGIHRVPWDAPRYRENWLTLWQPYYLMAQLLWNADADYAALYEDMGSKYYGKTWPAMKKYRELLTKAYEETPGHGAGGAGKCLEQPDVEKTLLSLLDEAEKAAGDDQAAMKKIKRDREYFQSYWQRPHEEYKSKIPKELNVRKRGDKIAVDGKFDEDDWKKADFITNFSAMGGKTAADPQTFVKMLYDENNIYLAIEAMEPEPAKMRIKVVERDGPLWDDCSLECFIAVPGTSEKYEHIIVNPNGVVYDALSLEANDNDAKFDSGLEIKTAILADRWITEIRIPTAALGRRIRDGETWKINIARSRYLVDGKSQLSSWSNGVFHGPEAYRSVVFGDRALIKNGDFEDAVDSKKKP